MQLLHIHSSDDNSVTVDMFFIDTQPMVQTYLDGDDMPDLLGQNYTMQLAWLEEELSTSDVGPFGLGGEGGGIGPVPCIVAHFSPCMSVPAW